MDTPAKLQSIQNTLTLLDRFIANPLMAPVVLMLIILVGLTLRVEDLADWHQRPNQGLAFGTDYYTTTFDGYHYLNIARDIAQKTPGESAKLKGIPDLGADSYRVPLLSVIIGLGSRISGLPEHHLGAMLIPLLGVLIAFPIYFLGRLLGGRATGLTAALFTLCVPYYVYRSAVGWIDTDALNPFFAFLAALLFARFGQEQTSRRYLYYLYGLVCYLIFLWWWDMAPGPVTVITFIPLAVVLLFHYRAPAKEVMLFAGANLLMLAGIFSFTNIGLNNLTAAISKLRYIAKDQQGEFPNVGVSISEQSTTSLSTFIHATAGEAYVMVIVLIGLGLLLYRKRSLSFIIAAPVILSIFSVIFAQRFLVFLAPVAGLGIGFLVQTLWDKRRQWRSAVIFAPMLAIGSVLPNISTEWHSTRMPKPHASLLPVFAEIKKSSPSDALIWTWWDYAYPVMYWAQRATIADGSFHPGERMVYLGYPLTVSSPRLSANFMHFFAVQGRAGMHRVYQSMGGDKVKGRDLIEQMLLNGPQAAGKRLATHPFTSDGENWSNTRWLEFFYPQSNQRRPIYLLLNRELMPKAYWWFWFGSWKIEDQAGYHPKATRLIRNLQTVRGDLTDNRTFYLNTEMGRGEWRGKSFSVQQMSQYSKGKYNLHEYPENPGKAGFTYYPGARSGMLYDGRIADSVYGKLYFASGKSNQYFKPVIYRPGGVQLWKVEGDVH